MQKMAVPRAQLQAYLVEFLQAESCAFLGTADNASLQPRVTPVHYCLDTSTLNLLILSDEDSSKLHNLEHNEKVSIAICDTAHKTALDRSFAKCKGLQITGTAKVLPHTDADSPSSAERAHALSVYPWQSYAKGQQQSLPQEVSVEPQLSGPPTQSIIVITPTKMELIDLTPAFLQAFPPVDGVPFERTQVWRAVDEGDHPSANTSWSEAVGGISVSTTKDASVIECINATVDDGNGSSSSVETPVAVGGGQFSRK